MIALPSRQAADHGVFAERNGLDGAVVALVRSRYEAVTFQLKVGGNADTDIVRIRNGEVCYWPNLGYGHFGAKVTMDNAPWFDNPDQFDHKRIRLADIDGSGTTDVIYLHRDGARLYFNQSGNSWSQPRLLHVFPRVDDLVSIVPIDLLGNGTACHSPPFTRASSNAKPTLSLALPRR